MEGDDAHSIRQTTAPDELPHRPQRSMLRHALRSALPVRRVATVYSKRCFASYPPHEVVGLPGWFGCMSSSKVSCSLSLTQLMEDGGSRLMHVFVWIFANVLLR